MPACGGSRTARPSTLKRSARFTTTNLTAEEIHQIGLSEVARIEKEMDAILRTLGRTQGSVKDRVEQLKKDLSYPLTEDGRTQIMADIDRIMRDAEQRAVIAIRSRPEGAGRRAALPAVPAKPTPPPATPSPARRRIPSGHLPDPAAARADDEVRPADRSSTTRRCRAITSRLALELENEPTCRVPSDSRLRRHLGVQRGLGPVRRAAGGGDRAGTRAILEGLLGQLDAALFRARRLVVDTGIHAKRWTRQQAIDYGIEASEVERYVVNPDRRART